ncbi:MAG TPA: hypothetical protein VHG29_00935 [Novosphingobium sp.]|nr:hypothetical protein [Novosphingobium sp.]
MPEPRVTERRDPVYEERVTMIRTQLFTRTALGFALAAGLVVTSVPALAAPKPPAAPKLALSKPFQTLAAPLDAEIKNAKTRPDVVAAKAQADAASNAYNQAQGTAARNAAKAQRDAAIVALGATVAGEKARLDAAFAAATTQDDKYTAGTMAVSLGGLAMDTALQRRGLQAMIDSGKPTPADAARFNFFIGSIAYDARDYAGARSALTAATTGGYHENDADALLADAYLQDNQVAQGLTILQQAINARKAAGAQAPANWFRRGLGAAYKARLLDQAAAFSMGLVENYPTTENWSGAITVVRELAKYPAQETLDLMRLMDRTKSFNEERDYIEYIQAADARRLPGEVQRILDAGLAAGKLRANDVFVSESKTTAAARITADRASLAGLERDASAAGATAATAMAAGDAFLSYADATKAERFYTAALTKPGVDTPRVLTRLGIAQYDLGKYAEAQATFAKVTGPRMALAKLWGIQSAAKAKPAA